MTLTVCCATASVEDDKSIDLLDKVLTCYHSTERLEVDMFQSFAPTSFPL